MRYAICIFLLILCGCVTPNPPSDILLSTSPDLFSVAATVRDSNNKLPVHIYIEGDGNAFNGVGRPTSDPTPRGTTVRDMVAADDYPNVAYIARPCQFYMDPKCTVHDWTDGRFSKPIIDSVANAIKQIAKGRPVILIGYSGGAMVSGLVIKNNPDINIKKWITIAGVLNHHDWTEYFGDAPLSASMDMTTLPNVSQHHFVAANDRVVPPELSKKWIPAQKMTIIPDATHTHFPQSFIIIK